jgi:hypothetical protein
MPFQGRKNTGIEETHVKARRLVYICDWLPPDFGAVGQYAMLFAREWAKNGWAVTLVGLTSGESRRDPTECVGGGTLNVIRVHRPTYDKQRFTDRLVWTVISNILLLKAALGAIRQARSVLFTGSPPLMLHFIAPLNVLIRKQLIYRITDFYPECLIAERGRAGFLLHVLLRLTYFWRRQVDLFEVLGEDQARRLRRIGIPDARMRLRRDPSPVVFPPRVSPLPLPDESRGGAGVILYSGNWGVAHDEETFIEAYSRYAVQSKQGFRFWLNAVGSRADSVESKLRSRGVFVHRSKLVPPEDLPRLLLAADVHLITLRDPFVGYVLPSKVHACIESGKRIIFVGSESSDVHLLASRALSAVDYRRTDVGDVDGLVRVLHDMEGSVTRERDAGTRQSWGEFPARAAE